ncbi:MAG: thiamine phosphate synthase [bacterium]|nr:thiamine phosphate synthase [bacterium]MDO5462193.1 thiamine phosphate synthase [bacterium]
MNDFGFYLVMTKPVVGYARCAEAAVRAGVKMLQLRMKDVSREAFLKTALEVRAITRHTKTTFIVNDDPEIAVACEADGVHLGQTDMALPLARKYYPQLKVFGLSTHNLNQVHEAIAQAPDYIGVGPVYTTPTKAIPDPTLGLRTMSEMIAAAPCPAIAIGGIDDERLPAVLQAGARNFAVVRAVCESKDPFAAIVHLQQLARETLEALS